MSSVRKLCLPELWLCPLFTFNSTPVELRNRQGDFVTDILIQDTHEDDGKGGKGQIEEQDVGIVVKVCHIEVAVNLVPEYCECPDDVLVEEIGDCLSKSSVGPATMHKYESLQKTELTNGIVR